MDDSFVPPATSCNPDRATPSKGLFPVTTWQYFVQHAAPAFTKGLLALWLGDPGILQLGASACVDILSNKFNDRQSARKVERFVATVGDTVLDDLSPYFETEFTRIKPGDMRSVLDRIIEIVNSKAFIQGLIDANLDRERFCASFAIEQHKATLHDRSLSSAFDILFNAIVAQLLQAIQTFPTFYPGVAKTLLARSDEILFKLDQISLYLERSESDEMRRRSDFLPTYLQHVLGELHEINLFGLTTTTVRRRYSLSVAYITLMAEASSRRVPVDDVLEGADKILILGPPGSGKTTLLQWIAVQTAERKFEGDLSHLNDLFPFFVRLRNYHDQAFPVGKRLITDLFPDLEDDIPPAWVAGMLREGRALLLCDGIDELPERRRPEAIDWILRISRDYPKAHIVATSRPPAVPTSGIRALGELNRQGSFVTAELQPMNLSDIEQFINLWHKAYQLMLSTEDERDDLALFETRLVESVKESESLRKLADNPLLLSLICVINYDRRGLVPHERSELYDTAVDVILERRDVERRINQVEKVSLTKARKVRLLEVLAFFCLIDGKTIMDREDVERRVAEVLPSFDILPSQAEAIVSDLCERSLILRQASVDEVEFSHKTFLEYMAARRIVETNVLGYLVDNVGNPDFAEVIPLAFAHANDRQATEIIDQSLCKIEQMNRGARRMPLMRLFVGARHCVSLPPEIRTRLRQRLTPLLPPRTAGEARILSEASDELVDLLKGRANRNNRHAVQCTKVLLATRSPQSLDVLGQFASIGNREVDEMLLQGWGFFPGRAYAQTVLAKCQTLTEVHVFRRGSLDGVAFLTRVEKLEVRDCDLGSFDNIGELVRLREIQLINCYGKSDLEFLAGGKGVETLVIRDCPSVTDFGAIRQLSKLRVLTISSGNLKDISFVKWCGRLEVLDIEECILVEEVKAIEDLRSLSKVILPSIALHDQLSTEFLMTREVD
jgi:hypothetical protein